jgi:hypothetical protein
VIDPIDQLLAIEEIKALKARYFRLVDTKDWQALGGVFAPDVAFDRTYGGTTQDPATGIWSPPLPDVPLVVTGRENVVQMVRNATERFHTVHAGFAPEIAVIDADHATGVWAMRDEISHLDGSPVLIGAGHYHETYRRLADGWAIATVRLTRLSIRRFPQGA